MTEDAMADLVATLLAGLPAGVDRVDRVDRRRVGQQRFLGRFFLAPAGAARRAFPGTMAVGRAPWETLAEVTFLQSHELRAVSPDWP